MSTIPRPAIRPAASVQIRVAHRPALYALGGAALLTALHMLALHRGPTWTSPLLIGDHVFDLGFALMMLLYALALGRTIARPLIGLSDDPLSEGLAALGIGLCAISLAILFAGFARLYYGTVFCVLWLALTCWLRAELAAIVAGAARGIARWRRAGMPTAPTLGQRAALLLAGLACALAALRAAAPVSAISGPDWDALAYHLAAPKIYLEAHRLVPLPDIPLANAPAGGDILFLPALLAGAEGASAWLSVCGLALMCAAIFAATRRLFSSAAGWLSVLLLCNTIWLLPIVPDAMPDLIAAFLLICGSADLLAWAQAPHGAAQAAPPPPMKAPPHPTAVGVALPSGYPRERVGSRRHARPREALDTTRNRLLPRAGLLLGGAVSCKLTNLPILLAAGSVIACSALIVAAPPRRRVARALRAGAGFIVAAAIPLAPWLLKNRYFFGNPLYPQNVATAEGGAAGTTTSGTVAVHPGIFEHAWTIASNLTLVLWHFGSPLAILLPLLPLLAPRRLGWTALLFMVAAGVAWLLFVPLFLPPRYYVGLLALADGAAAAGAVAAFARPRARPGRLLLAAALAIEATLWLATVPFDAPSRFWLAAVVLGEALAALIIGGLLRQRGRAALELPLVAFLCVCSLLNIFLQLRELDRSPVLQVAIGALSRNAYLAGTLATYPAELFVNQRTPPWVHVALVHVTTGYHLERPYLDDWYAERNAALLSGPAAARAELRRWCAAGVSIVILNRGTEAFEAAAPPRSRGAYAWLRAPGLAPALLFSANSVDVFRVRPCAVRP